MADQIETDAARKARVFLSYSRKDTAFVDRLAAALTARGYEVLLDREDISGGEAWKERLDEMILKADAVAFVISPDSVASPVCEWETNRTVELGKRLLPLCLRPVQQAPEQLARLNYIFVDTDEKFDDGVARLLQACDVDIVWVREHTRLTEDATRWDASGRRDDALLRGEELSAAEAWLAARPAAAPNVHETLMAFLQASRTEATASLERERVRLRRMRRLQIGVGGLVALAAIIVVIAGLGAARLISGIGQRSSAALAELARAASDEGRFDRAARYARAGLAGADWPLIGYDADAAEAELRRALNGPLRVILSGHEEGIRRVAFSPDGAYAVTASDDHTARTWNALTGEQVHELRGHEGGLVSVAYSRDGRRIVTASEDAVKVWDATTGAELLTLGGARVASLDATGDRVLAVSPDGVVGVWDIRSGVADAQRGLFSLQGSWNYAVFSSDGTRIATTSAVDAALWDAASGAPVADLGRHTQLVTAAIFSPDGQRLLTASHDGVAILWDARSGEQLITLRHGSAIWSVAFSANGTRVVTGSASILPSRSDRTARVWNVSPGLPDDQRQVAVLDTQAMVAGVAFSPDGTRVVTGGFDGTARVWDVTLGVEDRAREIALLRGHRHSDGDGVVVNIESVAFSADGTRILTASSSDHAARIWDAPVEHPLASLTRDIDGRIAFSPDGALLATVDGDGVGHVYDTASRREIARLNDVAAPWLGMSFSSDGARLVTYGGIVRVWDVSPGIADERRLIATVRGLEDVYIEASFSPDAARIVTNSIGVANMAHTELPAQIWDVSPGLADDSRQRALMRRPNVLLAHASFSPDGARVLTTGSDRTQVWDASNGAFLFELTGDDAASYSPDGAYIVTAEEGQALSLWDSAAGARRTELASADIDVHSIAFSPDGSRLLSLSYSPARIWDVGARRPLGAVGAPNNANIGGFSADGAFVVTSDNWGGDVSVWDVASRRSLAVLRRSDRWVSGVAARADGVRIIADRRYLFAGPSVAASRSALRRMACEGPLAQGGSRFTEEELNAAPVLDRALDGDACASDSPWRRIGQYL